MKPSTVINADIAEKIAHGHHCGNCDTRASRLLQCDRRGCFYLRRDISEALEDRDRAFSAALAVLKKKYTRKR
jgi:hypothetical protein